VTFHKALLLPGQRPRIDFGAETFREYFSDGQRPFVAASGRAAPPEITVVTGQALVPPTSAGIIFERTERIGVPPGDSPKGERQMLLRANK
jgi:hypothetical protein